MSGAWLLSASLLLLLFITGLNAQSGCWSYYPGTNIYGGTVNSAANTVASCQAACAGTTGCVSIDFAYANIAGNQCFLLTKQSGKNTGVSGVDHYDYTCSSTSNCQFYRFGNTNIYGGTLQSYTTLSTCQSYCIAQQPTCQSIDWSFGTSQCFFLTTQSNKNYNINGVDHYDYVCNGSSSQNTLMSSTVYTTLPGGGGGGGGGGGCTWAYYPGTNIFGGTLYSAANTVATCQAACSGTPGCVSIDFAYANAAGNMCFLLKTQSGKNSGLTGVDHYDYTCSSMSSTTINPPPGASTTLPGSGNNNNCSFSQPMMNTNIYGGMINPASTLQACMAACSSNTSCQGIDWAQGNAAGQMCFLLNTQANKNSGITGVTHYDYTCNNGTGQNGGGNGNQYVCQNTIDFYPQQSSLGGYNVPEIRDIAQCLASCSRIGQCQGFDFSASGCWFYFSPFTFFRKYYQPNVAQLVYDNCPENSISNCTPAYSSSGVLTDACASECFPRFLTVGQTMGPGGQVVTSVGNGNVTACLSYCFFRPDCVAVDYKNLPGQGTPSVCSYYTQFSSLVNSTAAAYVSLYILVSRCSPNCTSYWDYRPNTRYRLYNPTVMPSIVSQGDCLNACRVSQTCEAYQWTTAGSPSCTLADNFFEGSGVSDTTVNTGLWRENCNVTSLPSTPSVNGLCSFSQPMVNMNIYGGMINPASTLQTCMAACSSNTSCQGIDWAPGNAAGQMCFLLNTQANKNSGITGVTHYDYTCNNGSSATMSGTAFSSSTTLSSNCWSKVPNTLIYGGTQNAATSLSACQSYCQALGRTACMSIDWAYANAVGSQCFILNTQTGKTGIQSGVDHYDFIC